MDFLNEGNEIFFKILSPHSLPADEGYLPWLSQAECSINQQNCWFILSEMCHKYLPSLNQFIRYYIRSNFCSTLTSYLLSQDSQRGTTCFWHKQFLEYFATPMHHQKLQKKIGMQNRTIFGRSLS